MAEEIKNPVDENLAKKAEVNESTEQIQPEETEHMLLGCASVN